MLSAVERNYFRMIANRSCENIKIPSSLNVKCSNTRGNRRPSRCSKFFVIIKKERNAVYARDIACSNTLAIYTGDH